MQKIKSIKFVEEGGTSIAELLVKSNPFKLAHCGREGCWPCTGPMSIPSDRPVVVTTNNVQTTSSFVHISSQEEEETGQGEVGGREGARRRDPEEARDDAPAVSGTSYTVCRSSSDVVAARVEGELRLPGEEDIEGAGQDQM